MDFNFDMLKAFEGTEIGEFIAGIKDDEQLAEFMRMGIPLTEETIKIMAEQLDHEYGFYKDPNYDPNISYIFLKCKIQGKKIPEHIVKKANEMKELMKEREAEDKALPPPPKMSSVKMIEDDGLDQ